GARYWYLMVLPLVWLTVRGFRTAQERLAVAVPDAPARVAVLLAVCVLMAASIYVPWRAVGRYRNYRGFHDGYRELVARHGLDHALVLVSTEAANDFASAFTLNRAGLDRPGPVFARDLGPEANAALLRAFPDRKAWH